MNTLPIATSRENKLILNGDRYLAAAKPIADENGAFKFEEDITPPVVSKYSKSAIVKDGNEMKLKSESSSILQRLTELAPGNAVLRQDLAKVRNWLENL